MTGVWTDERRQAARERCIKNRIWEKSTGATTTEGKAIVSRNAYKGGHMARVQALVKQVNTILKEQKEALKKVGF